MACKDIETGVQCDGKTLNNLKCADNVSLITNTVQDLQKPTDIVNDCSKKLGLIINSDKTKVMAVSKKGDQSINITLNDKPLEQVDRFTYVGGQITSDGKISEDIKNRIGKGLQAMSRMGKIWKSKNISLTVKVKVYNTVVIPQMLYGAETCALKKDQRRLLTAEMSCLRRIMGVSRLQKIKNDEIRQRLGMEETVVDKVMHIYSGMDTLSERSKTDGL